MASYLLLNANTYIKIKEEITHQQTQIRQIEAWRVDQMIHEAARRRNDDVHVAARVPEFITAGRKSFEKAREWRCTCFILPSS